MGLYTEPARRAQGWIDRHEMAERPSRSFRFSEPGKGSIYAYTLTWAPGTLTLAGDLGELVLTQHHAMPTLEAAVAWAARSDADYLMSKSGRKQSIDRERTVEELIDAALERKDVRDALSDHFHIGAAWGAGLKRLLHREVPRLLEDLTDAGIPAFIYDLGVFDDWYGSFGWTAHDIYQVTALQHGCRMIRDAVPSCEICGEPLPPGTVHTHPGRAWRWSRLLPWRRRTP